MSTILKALRRLEEDKPPRSSNPASTTDAVPATDPYATDELRDRILAEESVAQAAAAAAQHDSARTRRLVVWGGAAVLLTLGLGVGIYTIMSAGLRAAPIPSVIAATPEPVSTPEVEAFHVGEGFAGAASPRTTIDRGADSPMTVMPAMPVAPRLSRFANSRRPDRTETYQGNEANGFSSEQALSDSRTVSRPSAVSVPVPVAVPAGSIAAANGPPVGSHSTPSEPPARSVAAESVAPPSPTPPRVADEMALAAVTPTPATRAANSPRMVAAIEPSLAGTPAEPLPPRRRPPPTITVKAPPSVSARQSTSPTSSASPESVAKSKSAESQASRRTRESQSTRESQPRPESSSVARLARPDLPDLTILRTSWHPSADRRSAKIRLEATDEILNLREGDAIGGLVIQEISPSAVLFKAGDVEVRRRVGHPGSGG